MSVSVTYEFETQQDLMLFLQKQISGGDLDQGSPEPAKKESKSAKKETKPPVKKKKNAKPAKPAEEPKEEKNFDDLEERLQEKDFELDLDIDDIKALAIKAVRARGTDARNALEIKLASHEVKTISELPEEAWVDVYLTLQDVLKGEA